MITDKGKYGNDAVLDVNCGDSVQVLRTEPMTLTEQEQKIVQKYLGIALLEKSYIDANGHLMVVLSDGRTLDVGSARGLPGPVPYVGPNGNWFVEGVDTLVSAQGVQGFTPYIGANGNWFINGTDTGKKAVATDGETPYIGANGNWWAGDRDLGVRAPSDQKLSELESRMNAFTKLPEGSTTGDAELIDGRVSRNGEVYANIGEHIRGETGKLSEEIAHDSNFLYEQFTANQHLRPIMYDYCTKGVLYKDVNGEIVEAESVNSSGKMLAPKNLCMHYAGSTAFVNFYRKNGDGSFTPDHSLLQTVTSSGYLHVASYASYKTNMVYDIPDGMYMEICEDKGKIELYAWDGVMFGMDVSANLSYPTTSETETWLNADGGSGVTVHGKAKHLLAKNAKIRLVHGFKNGVVTILDTTSKKYYRLPDGYDYFRFRLETDDNGAEPKSVSGDVSNYICVVADVAEEFPITNAEKVIATCKKATGIKWKPAKSAVVNKNTTISYKQGVEYNGLPYGSLWSKAHYVGWHVSPHTMINAANDGDSIFFDPAFAELTDGAPYYSTVCSAFATMCDGWACPQTNAGFFYDPDVETYYSYKPVLGQIYTDMYSHCVIPSKIARIENDTVVSAYESVRPVSLMTTRFMSIAWKDIWDWWNTSAGKDYYDTYGYVVYNPKSKRPIPYFDLENATITNGSARPYKGDKSVYTSAEDTVKINIKNGAATVLYLQKATGETINIPIAGATVDVKPYLDADGIYYVYTDADGVKESFEYVIVTPITYKVDDHALTFSDNDFWYASCYVTGHKQFRDPKYQKMTACVLARNDGDYTDWFAGTHKIIGVSGIFRKGVYGAYNVPLEEITL